jgi:uncharacterized paraquat-inducible protein A
MNAMPVIRCERCGTSHYVAVAYASRPECPCCGHQISVTRKALVDPVIAAGIAHRVPMPGGGRRARP